MSKWKKWRVVEPHPEDRYEPDDEVADGIREQIRNIESRIEANKENISESLNPLFLELRKLRLDLADRLYGT